MANLTRAHDELYRRRPDERFATVADLWQHCSDVRQYSTEQWISPAELAICPTHSDLQVTYRNQNLSFTDWSFSQLCRLAAISRDTLNKLSPETASRVFQETLPRGSKPLQLFTMGETIRWSDTDASGSVTVLRDGTSSAGRYCREYSQKIKIGRESQQAYGTACRNSDGSWEIVE